MIEHFWVIRIKTTQLECHLCSLGETLKAYVTSLKLEADQTLEVRIGRMPKPFLQASQGFRVATEFGERHCQEKVGIGQARF